MRFMRRYGFGSLENIWHPDNLELRGSVRLFEALQKVGLVDYWENYGWPDLCEDLPPDRVACPE